MYIGSLSSTWALSERLVAAALRGAIDSDPQPIAVRLTRWRDDVFTLAFDGVALPISLTSRVARGVPHPELYDIFLHFGVGTPNRILSPAGAMLNALAEKLVVSTLHEGKCYRAAFRRGCLISLLSNVTHDAPWGTTWLTFKPDVTVVPGTIRAERLHEIVEEVRRDYRELDFYERTDEHADWL
jgi:hypothetical protein